MQLQHLLTSRYPVVGCIQAGSGSERWRQRASIVGVPLYIHPESRNNKPPVLVSSYLGPLADFRIERRPLDLSPQNKCHDAWRRCSYRL